MAAGDGIQGALERFVWPELCGGARWKIFLTSFITRLIVVILALLLVWGLWKALKPENPAPDRVRVQAANQCAQAIRDELREQRGDYRTLLCVPFVGDSSGAVFGATRDAFVSSGVFDVCGKSFGERVRGILDLKTTGSNDAERAAKKARRCKADAALCGSVSRFETIGSSVALIVDYRLIDASTGQETYAGTYDSTKATVPASVPNAEAENESDAQSGLFAARGATGNAWGNFAIWLLAVLAFPIVSFRMLEAATAKRSNGANAFALTSCFVADAAFAWVLIQPTFATNGSILVAVLMGVFAIWYDAQVLRLAHRRTEDAPVKI